MTDMADGARGSEAADLAFLKKVAAAGQGRPAPAVPLMAVFGGGYGLAELVVWLEMAAFNGGRMFEGPAPGVWDTVNGVLFIGAHLAFLGALAWTGWTFLRTRGAGMNRGAAAAWTAAFAGLVTTIACVAAIGIRARVTDAAGEPLLDAAYCTVLILWGAAWWVTAAVTGRRWLGLVAAGSLVAALLAAWFAGDEGAIKLLGALCLLLLAFLPAAVLLLQARAGRG